MDRPSPIFFGWRLRLTPAMDMVSSAFVGMFAPDGLDDFVEALQKAGAVTFFQRRRSAGDLAGIAQFRQQVPGRHGLSDIVLGKRLPGCPDDARSLLQAPAGERDIGGDHNIVGLDVRDNPVVGRIGTGTHNLKHDVRLAGNAHPGVGDQRDIQAVTAGDAIDFLLDRTGIGIDEDMQHTEDLS